MVDIARPAGNQNGGISAPAAGAIINQTYLVRNQRSVAVNETDLEELLAFDSIQQGLTGAGIFFASGSTWLAIEKLVEQETFKITGLIGVCGVSAAFGIVLIIAGGVLFHLRRKKIKKIFAETSPV